MLWIIIFWYFPICSHIFSIFSAFPHIFPSIWWPFASGLPPQLPTSVRSWESPRNTSGSLLGDFSQFHVVSRVASEIKPWMITEVTSCYIMLHLHTSTIFPRRRFFWTTLRLQMQPSMHSRPSSVQPSMHSSRGQAPPNICAGNPRNLHETTRFPWDFRWILMKKHEKPVRFLMKKCVKKKCVRFLKWHFDTFRDGFNQHVPSGYSTWAIAIFKFGQSSFLWSIFMGHRFHMFP